LGEKSKGKGVRLYVLVYLLALGKYGVSEVLWESSAVVTGLSLSWVASLSFFLVQSIADNLQ
jgi:hypothetical protein